MNPSPFMDKQITGLSASLGAESTGAELLNLMNPQEERRDNGGVLRMEEILPSNFLSTRPPPLARTSSDVEAVRCSRLSSSNFFGDMAGYHETMLGHHNGASIEDVEITMKKYTDNLLLAVEGMSSRLLKLESRACIVENSVDDLKDSTENKFGSTDGKLKQLENILREVQAAVQLLRDKQEITDAHLQLARLQISEVVKTSEGIPDTQHQVAPPPQLQQPIQQAHQPTAISLSQPTPPPLPPPNAPPPPPQPQQNPPVQFPHQLLSQQHQLLSVPSLPHGHSYPIPSNLIPPPGQPAAATPPQQHQYQMQAPQHSQLAQYSQPLQPEDAKSYMPPSQAYPTNINQPTLPSQPPTRPSQHYLGASPAMFELPGSLPFPSSYGGLGFSEPYPYSSTPSHYSMKPSPVPTLPLTTGGSSSYQRLPTAKILPQAAPAGSSSSCGDPTGNKVPIDDVIAKVATMGFSRDQVRATVKKLTDNGQSVDLNVVLDKLMNSGEQPLKGWFRR